MTESPPTPSDAVVFDVDNSGRVTNLRLAHDWHVSTPPVLLGMTLTGQLTQQSLTRALEAMKSKPSGSSPPTVALAREIQARAASLQAQAAELVLDRSAEDVFAMGDSVRSQRAHVTVRIIWGQARSIAVDPSFAARAPRQAIIDEILEWPTTC